MNEAQQIYIAPRHPFFVLCQWGINLEGKLIRLILGASLCISISTGLSGQSLQDLEKGLSIAQELLDKVQNGRAPCYKTTCQEEKSELLHRIYRNAQLLSFLGADLRESIEPGIFAARRMLREKFWQSFESEREPQSIKDWFQFYKRRQIQDIEAEVDWLRFSNEVESLRRSFTLYSSQVLRFSPEDKKFFQEIWDRSYAEILKLYRDAQLLGEEARRVRRSGSEAKAEQIRSQMIENLKRARDLTENLGYTTSEIQARLFPQLELVQITELCLNIQRWVNFLNIDDLFSPSLSDLIRRLDKGLKELYANIQKFNELEYGIVGLNNFLSHQNPAIRAAKEHAILIQLEQKLDYARFVLNAGQSTYGMIVAAQLGGSSKLLQFGLIGLSNYIQDVLEWRLSEEILPRSPRIAKLESQYAYWEPRMLQRKEDLIKTEGILLLKIQELESRIRQLNTEGNENEENWTP